MTGTPLTVIDGSGAPTSYMRGLPYEDSALAVDSSGPVAHYHNGLPFTAAGRIAIEASVPSHYSQGWPITSNSKVAMEDAASVRVHNGVPITADNMIAAIGAASYDYYIDAVAGNDANDGTSEATAWATLSKINALNPAVGESVSVLVLTATYSDALDYILLTNRNLNSVFNITFQAGVTMDGTAANALAATNGIECSGASAYTVNLYGNGLNINNYSEPTALSPNGVGNRGSTTVNVYEVNVDNCDDGFSCHDTAFMNLYDCTAANAEKSPFIHADTSIVTATRCTFTATAGLALDMTAGAGVTVTLNDCILVPAVSGSVLGIVGVTMNRCRVGTEALRFELNCSSGAAFLNDCYINAYADGNDTITFIRCYGKFTVRVRNGGAIEMQRSVIIAPASGYSTILFSNFDPGSSSKFVFNNNIFEMSQAFDALSATLAGYVMAAASEFHNNILFGGIAYSANLIAADTGGQIAGTINSDPLIGAATGYVQSDYGFGPGSPAEGAGTPSGDIGFAA